MSTQDRPRRDDRPALVRTARSYAVVTAFVALFGAVYERFGHGVYSYYMIYAFAPPLLLGLIPALFFGTSKREIVSSRKGRHYWNAGVATVTVGCIFKGVLEIYGTDSPFFIGYLMIGAALLFSGQAVGAAVWILHRKKEKTPVTAKKGKEK